MNIGLEVIRTMDDESLTNLIFGSVYSDETYEFTNFVNIKRDKVNLLIAPNPEDKIILINVIRMCLSMFEFDSVVVDSIMNKVTTVHNNTNLVYTKLDDINYYSVLLGKRIPFVNELTIIDEEKLSDIIDGLNTYSLEDDDKYLLKTQLFIYASVWFDMDGYLKYLYELYS